MEKLSQVFEPLALMQCGTMKGCLIKCKLGFVCIIVREKLDLDVKALG